MSDTWQFLDNDWVPRGPIMGCHVAPQYWLVVLFVKSFGVHGVRPPDLLQGPSTFTKSTRPLHHHLLLVIYMNIYVFKFGVCRFWRGVGPGLSPGPWSCGLLYVTILYVCRSLCIMNGALAPSHTTRKHVTTYHTGARELKWFLK
jgi:hypothetical protein